MSKETLKDKFNKKASIAPSKNFDQSFFQKLELEKSQKRSFRNWWSYSLGSALALSLAIVFLVGRQPLKPSFNHSEYIESVLANQEALNEEISDLTEEPMDEI